MKTICQKSGIPIWKTDYLLGFDLADEHPIFKAKRNLILNKEMIFKFNKAETVEEKKLIFLAVLNHTYLVEFQYPANPSLLTLEKNFYRLFGIASWVSFAEYKLAGQVSFPQYVIRKDNADLDNIKEWLLALEDIKTRVNKRELERDKNAELLQKELEIKKELGEAISVGKAFTPRLAKWSLDVCEIRITHPDYSKWMKVLCVPLNEAWIYPMEDFLEVREILQDGLPNLEENPQAISVMHQVGQLIQECRRGFTQFSLIDASGNDFEIVEDVVADDGEVSQKSHKINQHMINVPTDQPQQKDYPTKVAYLIAKAKWDLSQARKGRQLGSEDV